MLKITTHSPEETRRFGAGLGILLTAGDVVCLTGTLGAGKTLLVQGICNSLGIPGDITSPTFTILNVYEGKHPVYHFDLYRLERPDELQDIGFDEYVGTDGIALIEWADKFPESMPRDCLQLEITPVGASERRIVLTALGEHYLNLIERVRL